VCVCRVCSCLCIYAIENVKLTMFILCRCPPLCKERAASSTSFRSKCASGLVGTVSSSLHTCLHAHSANANSDSLQYPLNWPRLLLGNTQHFGIVDTGATSQLVPEAMYLGNMQESPESVLWGNNSSSLATGIGSLYGITAGSITPGEDGVHVPMLVTSGQLDSYALPDIDQILFVVPVWKSQGHTCDFGPHAAGLTIKTRTGKM